MITRGNSTGFVISLQV